MLGEHDEQLRFGLLGRLSLGLAICGSAGCVKPVPKGLGTASADTTSLAPKTCPDDEPRTASADALGRLVTGPGLCSVEGGSTGYLFGNHVRLELSYDQFGRPVLADAEFNATCDFDHDHGVVQLSPDHPYCQGFEHHVQRWTWDEHGRLVGIERNVQLYLDEDDLDVDDFRCMMDDIPLTTDAISWGYEEHGRVETLALNYQYCGETRQVEEQLSYTDNMVEARAVTTYNGEPSSESSRYHLDDCGRVVHQEIVGPNPAPGTRYGYDEWGRLTKADGAAFQQSWTYEAIIATHPKVRWVIEESMDHRTIYLAEDRVEGEQFVIRLDERQRVISVKSDNEAWALHYDDCPNAALATNRWRLHEILWTWDFPPAPLPGKGNVALDRWLHAELPLLPESLD